MLKRRMVLVLILAVLLCAPFLSSLPFASASIYYSLTIDLGGHGTFSTSEVAEYSVLGGGLGYGVSAISPTDDAGSFPWGDIIQVTIHSDVGSNSSMARYLYDDATGTGDGSYTGSENPFTVTMNGDINEKISWLTQYAVTFASAGITSDSGANIVVVVAGAGKQNGELPFTAWYDRDVALAYSYSISVATAAGNYALASVSGLSETLPSSTFTVTESGTVIGTYTAPMVYGSGVTTTYAASSTSSMTSSMSLPDSLVHEFWNTLSWLSSLWSGSFYGISNMIIIALAIVVFGFIIGLMLFFPLIFSRRRRRGH